MSVPFLTNDQINAAAIQFLESYHPADTLPVPIEQIIEFDFEIDIVPLPELQRNYDIDGFLSNDLSSIYVDDFVHSCRQTRYRFTLAHEIGHVSLHKDILCDMAQFSTVSGWREFVIGMSDKDRSAFEYQAYAFAGFVLVPEHHLSREFSRALLNNTSVISQAKSVGLKREQYLDYAIETVASELTGIFDVSLEVLVRRIKSAGLSNSIE